MAGTAEPRVSLLVEAEVVERAGFSRVVTLPQERQEQELPLAGTAGQGRRAIQVLLGQSAVEGVEPTRTTTRIERGQERVEV